MTRSWADNVINCGGWPSCGRCERCRRIKPDLDPTRRLLAEQAQPGPKVSS